MKGREIFAVLEVMNDERCLKFMVKEYAFILLDAMQETREGRDAIRCVAEHIQHEGI
jgi:hypothetical protein